MSSNQNTSASIIAYAMSQGVSYQDAKQFSNNYQIDAFIAIKNYNTFQGREIYRPLDAIEFHNQYQVDVLEKLKTYSVPIQKIILVDTINKYNAFNTIMENLWTKLGNNQTPENLNKILENAISVQNQYQVDALKNFTIDLDNLSLLSKVDSNTKLTLLESFGMGHLSTIANSSNDDEAIGSCVKKYSGIENVKLDLYQVEAMKYLKNNINITPKDHIADVLKYNKPEQINALKILGPVNGDLALKYQDNKQVSKLENCLKANPYIKYDFYPQDKYLSIIGNNSLSPEADCLLGNYRDLDCQSFKDFLQ